MLVLFTRHHDALLHAITAVALTIGFIASGMPPYAAIAWNAALWFAREWDQKQWAVSPLHWPFKKHVEWVAPTLAGVIVGLILALSK